MKKRDVPIILVGTSAEKRKTDEYEDCVSSQDAVHAAQEYGVTKYIETFADNYFHIHELFQQLLTAVKAANKLSGLSEEQRKQQFFIANGFFKSVLATKDPEGVFDQLERTFTLATHGEEDDEFFYTLDGTLPDKTSQRYTHPIIIDHATTTVVVIAFSRCKYHSVISRFNVPERSAVPEGYFDMHTKAFHIVSKPNTIYYYTTDGTLPNARHVLVVILYL